MSLITHKKLYYINSKNRISGTNSRFTINIPFTNEDNFDRVAVLQATIPKSFYLVQSGQNTFTLTEGVSSVTITIPIGNYSRRSLQDTVQDLLNTASPFGLVYTVTWPAVNEANTGKFTFTCNNGGIQPIFTFSDNNIAQYLGFNPSSSYQFSAYSLTSANVINLQNNNIIYLHSDICTNGNDDVLQEIYTAAGDPTYSNIHYENYDFEAYSKQLVSKSKTLYEFYLTDKNQIEVDLNGVDFHMTLVLFKHNDISQLMREWIRWMLHREGEVIEVTDQI